jgi:hypothetical protein
MIAGMRNDQGLSVAAMGQIDSKIQPPKLVSPVVDYIFVCAGSEF